MTGGVYVIYGPAGAYVGVTSDTEQRQTLKLARLIGLTWIMVRRLPLGLSRTQQHQAEHTVIEDYRRAGITVVTNGCYRSGVFPPELRFSHKGRKHSPEARARMSVAHRGIPKSAAHRAAISAAQLGRAKSPEHYANIRTAAQASERREKVALALRGNRNSAGHVNNPNRLNGRFSCKEA